jgi:hypothetical protein
MNVLAVPRSYLFGPASLGISLAFACAFTWPFPSFLGGHTASIGVVSYRGDRTDVRNHRDICRTRDSRAWGPYVSCGRCSSVLNGIANNAASVRW